jgi:hypothetical protein
MKYRTERVLGLAKKTSQNWICNHFIDEIATLQVDDHKSYTWLGAFTPHLTEVTRTN